MARAVVGLERRLQNGQAGRGEQGAPRCPGAPGAAISVAPLGANPQTAEARANQIHPDGEDASPAQPIAKRSAEEEEGGEGQSVPGDDPLQRAELGVERAPDGGQRDPDHGAVQGGDARSEDRTRQ